MSALSRLARYNMHERGLIEWFAPEYILEADKVTENLRRVWFENVGGTAADDGDDDDAGDKGTGAGTDEATDTGMTDDIDDSTTGRNKELIRGRCVHRPLVYKNTEREARQAIAYMMCVIEKDYKLAGGGLPHFMFLQRDSDIVLYVIPSMPVCIAGPQGLDMPLVPVEYLVASMPENSTVPTEVANARISADGLEVIKVLLKRASQLAVYHHPKKPPTHAGMTQSWIRPFARERYKDIGEQENMALREFTSCLTFLCVRCGKKATKWCETCRGAMYCSMNCQRAHRSSHSQRC